MSRIPRLKQRRDFLKVASTRKKWVTPGLILQVRARPAPPILGNGTGAPEEIPDIRIGFTVSKKVGNAVARNRARRRLRALADLIVLNKARDGFDLVLIGRRETVDRPFSDLEKDLKTALWRTGVHKNAPPDGQKLKKKRPVT